LIKREIASLRSQRQLKGFFNSLLKDQERFKKEHLPEAAALATRDGTWLEAREPGGH
jgi:hypothetical protein